MALFNEILNARYNRILEKLYGIKGHPVAPQASPEIQGSIILANDRPDFEYLAGNSLASGTGALAALAANFNLFQLLNPTASGVLITCYLIIASVQTNDGITIMLSDAALTSLGTAVVLRDRRVTQSPVGQFRQAQATAQPGTFVDSQFTLANSPYAYNQPVILPPGRGIVVSSRSVNIALATSFHWTERILEASEI